MKAPRVKLGNDPKDIKLVNTWETTTSLKLSSYNKETNVFLNVYVEF